MTRKKSPTSSNTGLDKIQTIYPLTENQKRVFDSFDSEKHLVLSGSAGTGKTFLALYLALKDVFDKSIPQDNITIVRSTVESRAQGFLPGNVEEKSAIYELAYRQICSELYGRSDAYEILKSKGVIKFISTSYVRGLTLKDSVVIVDEMQNLSFHEIYTIATRLGENSRIIFCGDLKQNDLSSSGRKQEISGFQDLIKVISHMEAFEHIQFGQEDIVRSDFVREWIIKTEELGLV